MNVLLDIGAHEGQSLEEFVTWPFDAIHAFEPMPAQFQVLCERFAEQFVRLHFFGLADESGTRPMYGANQNCEASLFPTKVDVNASTVTQCLFVRASDWFAEHLSDDDAVYVKMNCEGAETLILNDLCDSGEIRKVKALRFEMDISRCVGHEDQADKLLARLDDAGVDYTVSSDARLVNGRLVETIPRDEGTHQERLHRWLERVYD